MSAPKRSFSLNELAALTDSKLIGNTDYQICNVADLESAGPEEVSFLIRMLYGQSNRYEQAMLKSAAGAIFVHPDTPIQKGRNYLLNDDPSRAFQKVLEAFHGQEQKHTSFTGIHNTAVIHPSAKLGKDVCVGPYSVIDKDASIGDRTKIGSGCFIGPGVVIGGDCLIHAHVTVREKCFLGNRVILQPGAVIGSCGFGYTTDKQGKHQKLDQVGIVTIEDDVEIGANSTIDRSRFKSTRIGRGTKIDNLVQIGHGAQIGPDNMIVAQTGIAGSAQTGRHVVLAGQCGVAGHIKLSDGVILSARSGADKSLPSGRYGGVPSVPLAEHNKIGVHLRNLPRHIKRLKELEERVAKLENP